MDYLDSVVTTQICPFYNEGDVGFCWDDACDHAPPTPSKASHHDQKEVSKPSSPSVLDPWSTTAICCILGRHEKGSTCDDTCQVSSSSDDDDEDDPRDDEYLAKKRFRNTAVGKRKILGIVKRKKAVKAENRAEYMKSGPVLRRQLIAKRRIEGWVLPKWKRYEVIQKSLLGL